jgi:hypothetical protein
MYKMSQIFAVFNAEKDEKETKRVQSLLVSRLSNALLGRSANLAETRRSFGGSNFLHLGTQHTIDNETLPILFL